MLITLTAMGENRGQVIYIADITRNGNHRRIKMTPGLAKAINRRIKAGRAKRLWSTKGFLSGRIGRQRQYKIA